MTAKQQYVNIQDRLSSVTDADESKAMSRVIFEDVLGITPVKMALNPDLMLESDTVARVNAIVDRVVAGEPLQYVIGHARFMGMDFAVTPATLIPRPETQQLVDMIVSSAGSKSDLHVLDIGTGSGCIAISLARALVHPQVSAIDISAEALAVAQENARNLRVDVNFKQCDALALTPEADADDIIVSNPPYVADSEASAMEARVLDYEPHRALFVPDSDPLRFYRAISLFAIKSLRNGGRLYFEINPLFVKELRAMLNSHGWDDVDIIRDFRGKERFAVCQL